jgi:hypothetical protein
VTQEQEEIKKKKEYLQSYERAIRQMKRSELKMQEMRLNTVCPSVINDGMPHVHNNNDLSSYVSMLDQEEKRYMKYRYQRIKKCKEITDRIENLRNENEKDILMLRYIRLMSWGDIAVKMGFSWQHTHRIHAQALKNFKMR